MERRDGSVMTQALDRSTRRNTIRYTILYRLFARQGHHQIVVVAEIVHLQETAYFLRVHVPEILAGCAVRLQQLPEVHPDVRRVLGRGGGRMPVLPGVKHGDPPGRINGEPGRV